MSARKPSETVPLRNGRAGGDFSHILEQLLARSPLTEQQAYDLFDTLFDGNLPPERLAACLAAIATRPVAPDELVGFARAMRHHAVRCEAPPGVALDNCGTGGAPRKTFNISTAAAFVLAGDGIFVAKHGNRSVTRPSGSADVLEAAGARLDLTPAQAQAVLADAGISFLFAPTFHPAMRFAGPVRAALGVKTVFNLLGPLANPVLVERQVVGVYHPDLVRPVAEALARLGCKEGFVIHGLDADGQPGFDEATPCGPVVMARIRAGEVEPVGTWNPVSEGLVEPRTPEEICAVSKAEASQLFLDLLAGTANEAATETVVLNVALGLVAAGRFSHPSEAVPRATELLRDGVGKAKWHAFVEATQRLA